MIKDFFSHILPFVERLEREDRLLLVTPAAPSAEAEDIELKQGIVLSLEIYTALCSGYLAIMQSNVQRFGGSLERYFDFISRNPKWASRHNPDRLILALCNAARMVIGYRYAIACGAANVEHYEIPSSIPLFITIVDDDGTPTHVGYEVDETIQIDSYHAQDAVS